MKREGLRRVLLALGPEALTDVAMEKSDLFQREQMLRHVEAIAQDPSGDAVSWDAALVELIDLERTSALAAATHPGDAEEADTRHRFRQH